MYDVDPERVNTDIAVMRCHFIALNSAVLGHKTHVTLKWHNLLWQLAELAEASSGSY